MRRVTRWLPHLALLTLLALVLSLLPATPAQARKRTQNQAIDDKLVQFAEGSLSRTALTPIGSNLDPAQGGIELAPLAYVDSWDLSAFQLPERVTAPAAASLGSNVYVLGGLVAKPGETSTTPTSNVWRGTLSPTGNISSAWLAQPALPDVPPSTPPGGQSPCAQTTAPLPARSNSAAASFDTGSGGFIYAIGGTLASTRSGENLSTSAVAIATVNASGDITGWRNGPCLPEQMQEASATTIAIGGETYLYVVGGLVRRRLGLDSYGLRTTYFARLDASTGDIRNVGDGSASWSVNTSALPIPDDVSFESGLWNASLVPHIDTAHADKPTRYALYIAGGQTVLGNGAFNAAVYRGIIDPATKQVDWGGNSIAALNSARTDLTGISYNGNIMYIAGRTGVDPISEVLSNQVNDNLDLQIPDGTSNFYKSTLVLKQPRYNHATTIAAIGGKYYVYVFGGQGLESAGENVATDTVFYGKIGADGVNTGYATSGWFVSKPRKLQIDNSKVLAITWNSKINRGYGMDIAIEYRTTGDPTLSENTWSAWKPIADPQAEAAGYKSKDGANGVQFPEGVSALYFQYRAELTTAPGTPGAWQTPALLDLNIQIEVPGFPNLQVADGRGILVDGQLRALEADIANRNPKPVNEPLQPVSDGNSGSFFVSVFIFKPGETAVDPGLGTVSEIYAEVNKQAFPYGTPPYDGQVTIRNWCSTASDCSTPYNISQLFTVEGTYTVYIYVDNVADATGQPYGNVEEADVANTQGEADNLFKLEVKVTVPCPDGGCDPLPPTTENPGNPRIFLPVIGKAVAVDR